MTSHNSATKSRDELAILVICGTRPEAIKLAPVISQLKRSLQFRTDVLLTGQHDSLVDGILQLWGLEATHIVQPNERPAGRPAVIEMLAAVDEHLLNTSPSLIVVQGDTASALAGALAGFSSGIRVAHVEAGLRSGDLANPWPEEGFRRSIDAVSSYLFAPTAQSQDNLRTEQVLGEVHLTGNTVVDALEYIRNSSKFHQISLDQLLPPQVAESGDFVLFTQHRRESFAFGMSNVLQAVQQIAREGMPVVMPVHPNPNVVKLVAEHLQDLPNVHLIPPQNYLTFLRILESCRVVVSDSGGVQEEAPSFGKRVVITRTVTERQEILHSGHGVLCGFNTEQIVHETRKAWESPQVVKRTNPFGDGQASIRIVEIISRVLEK